MAEVEKMNGTQDVGEKRYGALEALRANGDGVEGVRCGDEEGLAILSAEANVGCPSFRNRDHLNLFPFAIENRDAFAPCQIDVPISIDGHPIGALRAKKFAVHQRPILRDRVLVGFLIPDIGDIEQSFVSISHDPVGLDQRIVDTCDVAAIAVDAVDAATRLRFFFVIPPRALVVGIGKVDRSIPIDPQIIGSVEYFSFKILEQNSVLSVGENLPHLVLLVCTGDQLVVCGEEHAIAAPCWLEKLRHLPLQIHFHDSVIGLVGEVNVPVCVGRRAFGKLEAIGD